jgi:hypothetical protein
MILLLHRSRRSRRSAELVDPARQTFEVRNALLAVEEVFVVRAQHRVRAESRTHRYRHSLMLAI